jgi:hypothetical protein
MLSPIPTARIPTPVATFQIMAFQNVATWDRLLRLALGCAMLAGGLVADLPRIATAALLLFCWVPIATALAGWCPFYSLFGLRTRHRRGRRPLRPPPSV